MAALLTATQAKTHLKRPDLADDDPDLVQLMAGTEATIVRFLRDTTQGTTYIEAWQADPAAMPADALHAILVQLDANDRFRGGDLEDEMPARDVNTEMHPAVAALLKPYRGIGGLT